jgi:serine/threonine-protein kinase
VIAGGTWFLLNDGNRGSDGAATGTSASQTSAAPTGIQLSSAFVGRPADEVQATLEAAGLVVRQEEADDDALASAGQALDAGDVAALDPSDGFAGPGSEVVLYVAADAYTPDDGGGSDSATPTTEATTSSTATETTTPTTTAGETSSSSPSASASVSLPGEPEPEPSPSVSPSVSPEAVAPGPPEVP